MFGARGLLVSVLCLPVWAETPFDALKASVMEWRNGAPGSNAVREATPLMTVVKHRLRDWVGARIQQLKLENDPALLQHQLNAELKAARLDESAQPADNKGPDYSYRGYLGDVQLKRTDIFLIVQTRLGILCGFDESGYLFSWSQEGWHLAWQSEQNTYTDASYKPQTIAAVQVSPYTASNNYLVLTLGIGSWCTSAWHPVYYRAFRLGPELEPRPLIEGDEIAYLGTDRSVEGSVKSDDVLVEFRTGSIDPGVHNRAAIRHYKIVQEQPRRVAPLALSPRDFVDEWLTHDWKEARFWTEDENVGGMVELYKKLHEDRGYSEFLFPTKHCPSQPDTWQVGIDFSDPATEIGADPKTPVYFLVRWRPPWNFSMVNVSSRPWPGCTEADRKEDEEQRTLFPRQDDE